MKRQATQKSSPNGIHRAVSFEAVFDSRKRKIAGLWRCGSRYFKDAGSVVAGPRS